jgi:transposase-like protein
MNTDSENVSGWFVLNAGFKVQVRCPACHSPNVSYHKVRRMGLKGISAKSRGLTPACMDCGKNLPTKVEKEGKKLSAPVKCGQTMY